MLDALHPHLPRLLEVHEVAYLLRCSQETVRRRIREHKLKAVRIGKQAYRVKPADLEAFIEAQRVAIAHGERALDQRLHALQATAGDKATA